MEEDGWARGSPPIRPFAYFGSCPHHHIAGSGR